MERKSSKIKALSELQNGEKGRVVNITAKGSIRRRVIEMGITKGTDIQLLGCAPLGDPLKVLVKGYHLSLRKDEASYIFVEVED